MNFSIVCYCLFLMLSSSFWYLILDRGPASFSYLPIVFFFTRTCFKEYEKDKANKIGSEGTKLTKCGILSKYDSPRFKIRYRLC
ncbi:hypothetical protein RIR_jg535.t1 [Rhizophagus irregularis DAOM 181602=DAOM 197198]|nr:hypothetical protein RIR_jg535.t1 [Rhizophagus irregularis DAOM 181602=DAOM 197198]